MAKKNPKATERAANSVVLMIKGQPVAVTYETVEALRIKLDAENPRVRLQVQRKFGGKKPSEPELIGVVREQPGFPELQKAIRENGGLHDPLIVRHNDVVAEGNSRAVVLRILGAGKPEDERWHTVPVMRLPQNLPEPVIACLLASYHVAGKTPWRLYAKAEHIYHLKNSHQLSVPEIAQATRMSSGSVEDYLAAFDYFQKELAPGADPEVLENKFSHALELMKGKKLASVRDDPEKRKLVTRLIRDNTLSGQDVRHIHKFFKNKKAVEALKKGRVATAKKAVAKSDPTVASKFLKKMEALEQELGRLPGTDIETLKINSAAARILIRLHSRIVEIAGLAKIELGVIHGAARAKRA